LTESATPGSAAFPAAVKAMLQKALLLRDERDARKRSLRSARRWATRLTQKIFKLSKPRKKNSHNERLAAFLDRHANELFTFLRHPDTDATNWRGEHAMRQAVVNRKVFGGNRTRAGADVQAILTSVLRTLKLRGVNAVDWLKRKLLSQPRHALA
jgi:transposase